MKHARFLLLLLISVVLSTALQSASVPPRLVVVVSFDQHRGDYFQSFQRFIGKRGFSRIAREGVVFERCYYDHANNITGPGHAAIMTGCYPWKTGIVGNDFCDARTGRCGYCADNDAGVKSPAQLRVPTLGDVLRSTRPQSKVVGVSLKDRASILMAGHRATACVWYDASQGGWTTSASYKRPTWLRELRTKVSAARYADSVWRNAIPDSLAPAVDDVDGEGGILGNEQRHVFPYKISTPVESDTFDAQLAISPYSMRMLFDAVQLVIARERLGSDAHPDILCVGVSTPDYVGHVFGPDSREVQELYVHADHEIARLIDMLDYSIGRNEYVLVVTSDHGVGPIPEVIRRAAEPQHTSVDAGRLRASEIKGLINTTLTQQFGTPIGGSWVDRVMPPSIYLRDSALIGMQREVVVDTLVAALRRHPQLAIVATPASFLAGESVPGADNTTVRIISRSMYPDRSGDVVMYPKRYWIFGSNPATHGTPYDYDRWVPLMILGNRIVSDTPTASVAPVDIASTLATLLGITLPDVDGRPLPIRRK